MSAITAASDHARRSDLNWREIAFALLVGGAAMGLNFLEVQLGWGLHFIFGNALIFAFLRVASPRAIIMAAAFASFCSVMLWGHPWAWLIWTVEAAVLAYAARRTSPVRADVLFWLFLGIPLLALTYGWLMGMDRTSLMLVIGKQAVNGVLNVALGEVLYLLFLIITVRRRRLRSPTVSIEATFQTFTMLTILVPTIIYLSVDAPNRETEARDAVASRLEDRTFVVSAKLDNWHQAQEAAIRALVHEAIETAEPNQSTVDRLRGSFDAIAVIAPDGGLRMLAGPRLPGDRALLASVAASAQREEVPTLLARSDPAGALRLLLAVPQNDGSGMTAFALLRREALARVLGGQDQIGDLDLYLLGPDGLPLLVVSAGGAIFPGDRALPPQVLAQASRQTVAVGPRTYGNSLMSDLKKASMLRAIAAPGLPGWQILAGVSLEPGVLRARQEQSVMFLTLFGLIVAMMVLSATLAKRLEISLRRIARAAAEVTLAGTRPDRVDSLVISELNDISVNVAIADTQVTQERSALVDYQRRLLSIATHAPVVVYALGRSGRSDGRLLYISDSVEKMLGYRTLEARTIGWLLRKIHPEDRARYEAAIAQLQEGDAIELEYRMRHRLGHWVWIYDTIALASDPYFKRSETVGLMIDVTDRKAAAEQLVQADKLAGLGQMVAGIAHELNQPLNFIRLAVDNLKERAARNMLDKERLVQKLEQVGGHVDRAAAIIQQMRVFGRTSTEPPRPIALIATVNAVLTMVRPQLASHGISVDNAGMDPAHTVWARPNLLEQVLLNLFLNADHAIRMRMEEEPDLEGLITLSTRREGQALFLIFDDNGTGIAPEAIKKLFDPFFTTKPPKEGMGLGLSVSYEIIRDLGGEISASNNGNGARFTIRLVSA